MGVHSGKFGAVDGISTVRNWSITDDMNNPAYAASNTRNGTGRVSGIEMWSGSFGYYGVLPPVMPGEFFDFLGYTAPDDDTEGDDGTTLAGVALVDSVAITWNWQNGDILSGVTNFSGHLDLTETASDTVVSDTTDPDVPSVCGTKIQYSSNGSDFSNLTNLLQATLTISAANQSYVNSETGCWTGRKPGKIDFTLAITRQDNTKLLVKGNNYVWRCFTDAVDYWELKYGKVKNFSNLTVDDESGAIIQHVVNVEKNAFGAVLGHIKKPGGTTFWPAP